MKVGAWTACPRCLHTPQTHEEQARHLLATDHYYNHEELAGMAAHIESGQSLEFDEKEIAEIAAELSKPENSPARVSRDLYTIALIVAAALAVLLYFTFS